jgi:hypothetical protein
MCYWTFCCSSVRCRVVMSFRAPSARLLAFSATISCVQFCLEAVASRAGGDHVMFVPASHV